MKETAGPAKSARETSRRSRPAGSRSCDRGQHSGMLRQDFRHPRVRPRLDVDRPKVAVVDILQRHRHDSGPSVDINAAEELQPETWREIFALLRAAPLLEHRRWPEGVVK